MPPDWYLAACLRSIADVVRQGVDDAYLLRAWAAYLSAWPEAAEAVGVPVEASHG